MNTETITALDLSGLRDIHAPVPPAFFPPAIGWWLVLGGILVIVCGVGIWYRFYYMSSRQYTHRVLREIERAQLPTVSIGVESGRLLKRVALVCFPREKVARLSGETWATFLYNHGGGTLTRAQAAFIAESAYMPVQKTVAIDEKKFYTAVRKWIDFVFRKKADGN